MRGGKTAWHSKREIAMPKLLPGQPEKAAPSSFICPSCGGNKIAWIALPRCIKTLEREAEAATKTYECVDCGEVFTGQNETKI